MQTARTEWRYAVEFERRRGAMTGDHLLTPAMRRPPELTPPSPHIVRERGKGMRESPEPMRDLVCTRARGGQNRREGRLNACESRLHRWKTSSAPMLESSALMREPSAPMQESSAPMRGPSIQVPAPPIWITPHSERPPTLVDKRMDWPVENLDCAWRTLPIGGQRKRRLFG